MQLSPNNFRLFKYRPIDAYAIRSIETSTLFGARPETLNDPFDCQIDIGEALDRAIRKTAGDRQRVLQEFVMGNAHHLEDWRAHAKDMGVCAYSMLGPQQLKALPLWSHYADHHRGLCLLYQFTPEYLGDPANGYLGVDKVHYGHNVLTEWLINGPEDPRQKKFILELLKLYVTVKAQHWDYEEEGRLLRMQHGEFAVPKDSLIQVCFGLRTPKADVERISALVHAKSECKSIWQMVRTDSDFGITAVELQAG